jgi:hypothetical protein
VCLALVTINMHSFGGSEWMFKTLFLSTFGISTRVKWGFSRKYYDTALSRRHFPSRCNSILPLASQNTLSKTTVQHFPITYEAVTDIFMLHTNHRNIFPSFSWPHTSIKSRYNTICIFQNGVAIRVTYRNIGLLDVFESSLTIYRNDVYICYFMCTCIFYVQ